MGRPVSGGARPPRRRRRPELCSHVRLSYPQGEAMQGIDWRNAIDTGSRFIEGNINALWQRAAPSPRLLARRYDRQRIVALIKDEIADCGGRIGWDEKKLTQAECRGPSNGRSARR